MTITPKPSPTAKTAINPDNVYNFFEAGGSSGTDIAEGIESV